MKLKHIAAAVLAVAAVTPAMALVTTTGGGDSELFLVVYGTGLAGAPNASYTLDLGISEKTFLGSQALSATLGGTNWGSFTSTIDLGTAKWAVMGGDNTGVGVGARNLLTTVQAGSGSAASTLLTDNLTSTNTNIDAYLGEVNQTGTHVTLANGDSFNATGSLGYFLTNNGNTVNNQLPFDNSNLIGASSAFTNLIRTANGSAVNEQVQAGTLSFASVGGSYKLSYDTVPAVPEPGGIALAMTALGMLGFVGRRRKQD